MSPKLCSLAYEDAFAEDQGDELACETHFDPKFEVIINKRMLDNPSPKDEMIKVRGRINVSF